jgi:hypothetical protein
MGGRVEAGGELGGDPDVAVEVALAEEPAGGGREEEVGVDAERAALEIRIALSVSSSTSSANQMSPRPERWLQTTSYSPEGCSRSIVMVVSGTAPSSRMSTEGRPAKRSSAQGGDT